MSFSSARASKIAHRLPIESLNQNIELAAQECSVSVFQLTSRKANFYV